jgi:hypothetical protein
LTVLASLIKITYIPGIRKIHEVKYMTKKLFYMVIGTALISTLAFCGGGGDSRRDATTVGENGWIFEGWACAPDAAAGQRGESPGQYCKGKKKEQMDYLYLKYPAAASDKAIKSGRLAQMMSTCRDAALTQIKGDGLSKIIGDYLEQASGVADGQSTGVAIVRQSAGKISGTGIYDCCAVDNNTGKCVKKGEKENWEQCICVGYMRFKGGQDALEAMASEVQR